MSRIPPTVKVASAIAIAIVLGAAVLGASGAPAKATHMPADKIAVSGSALKELSAPLVDGVSSKSVTLLSGTIKTSSPTDLIITVSAECAIFTQLQTVGNDDASSAASIKVWVERNGVPIPVSSNDGTEIGKVVFCDRTHRQVTEQFDDENATIRQYLDTRSANTFSWITMNTGSTPLGHLIEVKALLEAKQTGVGDATAYVGKRTLVVEPVKLANDAVL